MSMPTASSLGLAMTCNASAVFQRVGNVSEAADSGTELHKFCENVIKGMEPVNALALVPEEYRKAASEIDTDAFPVLDAVETEVTFAFSPITGMARVLGRNLGRDYSGATSDEFVGTVDYLGWKKVDSEGPARLVMGDWKTGSAFTVKSINQNWQMKFAAVAGAAHFREDEVEICIYRTRSGRPDSMVMETFDLDVAEAGIKALFRSINSGEASTKMVTGDHCKYCPSWQFCPAHTSIVRKVIRTPELMKEEMFDKLSVDEKRQVYYALKGAKDVFRKLDAYFYMMAQRGEILELEDGKVFGKKDTQSKELDAKVVLEVLNEMHGKDVAKEACTFDTSQAGIERAIATIAPRGKKASMVREAMQKIADAGGVQVVAKEKVLEYKPGED